MLFAEGYARLLLVIHTVAAVALVAAATHLVVWMRGFPRGRFPRLSATRRFGLISAALFVLTFVLGNLVYPVYKVRVRAEYLDQPTALMTDLRSRADSRARAAADHYSLMPAGVDGTGGDAAASAEAPSDAVLLERAGGVPRRAAKVARWFDVKEHWVSAHTTRRTCRIRGCLGVGTFVAPRSFAPANSLARAFKCSYLSNLTFIGSGKPVGAPVMPQAIRIPQTKIP